MPQDKQPSTEPAGLAVLRLIVTALAIGSCVFGGTVIFSASRIGGKLIAEPIVPYIIAGIGLMTLVIQWLVVPGIIHKNLPPNASNSTLLKTFGMEVIARAGLLEGAAILHFIFYLLTRGEVLLVTGAMLVLGLLLLRPSEQSFREWCEARRRQRD